MAADRCAAGIMVGGTRANGGLDGWRIGAGISALTDEDDKTSMEGLGRLVGLIAH